MSEMFFAWVVNQNVRLAFLNEARQIIHAYLSAVSFDQLRCWEFSFGENLLQIDPKTTITADDFLVYLNRANRQQ